MSTRTGARNARPVEPVALVLVKALVMTTAVTLLFAQLATPAGIVAAAVGTIAGYLAARHAQVRGVRVAVALAVAALAILVARLAGGVVLDHTLFSIGTSLGAADAIECGLGLFGAMLALRTLSHAWRPAALLELGAVIAAVAHTFAGHRHHHINEPRFLTDWAWSHGIDPSQVLEGFGVAAVVLAALLLLEPRRLAKHLWTFALLIALGVAAYLLLRGVRLVPAVETNDIALTGSGGGQGSGDGNGGGGGGSGNGSGGGASSSHKPPDPVAVVVLRDELPDADILYLRQSVLSRFAVDRLVEETSDRYDHDLIRRFPSEVPERVTSPEAPELHRLLHTSVYLLVDHAQPFGVGQPFEVRRIVNPSPRQFVAAYDVDSYMLDVALDRLAGRTAVGADMTADERAHYTALPADPRYVQLSNQIVRDMDPRFVGDDLMKALSLKRYLEKNGVYSASQKSLVGADPTAKFLFGEMRGYCVHFAHAMVFLLRSQGIPARVALGYAVSTAQRGAGTSLLVLGNEAHAWPELYLDGVGWITFDVYPERSDEPPPPPVDGDLESMLGELAHDDKTGGRAADPDSHLEIPWLALGAGAGGLVAFALVLAYAIKITRRLRRSSHVQVYRGALDALSGLGLRRRIGESRERHAARVAAHAPSFPALTTAHLRAALGGRDALPAMVELAGRTRRELAANLPFQARLRAALHPLDWWLTR